MMQNSVIGGVSGNMGFVPYANDESARPRKLIRAFDVLDPCIPYVSVDTNKNSIHRVYLI